MDGLNKKIQSSLQVQRVSCCWSIILAGQLLSLLPVREPGCSNAAFLPPFPSRRYEEEMYWRRVEEEQLYWEEQQRRHLAADWPPPPLMGRPGVPVPPLLVGIRIWVAFPSNPRLPAKPAS